MMKVFHHHDGVVRSTGPPTVRKRLSGPVGLHHQLKTRSVGEDTDASRIAAGESGKPELQVQSALVVGTTAQFTSSKRKQRIFKTGRKTKWVTREIAALDFLMNIPMQNESALRQQGTNRLNQQGRGLGRGGVLGGIYLEGGMPVESTLGGHHFVEGKGMEGGQTSRDVGGGGLESEEEKLSETDHLLSGVERSGTSGRGREIDLILDEKASKVLGARNNEMDKKNISDDDSLDQPIVKKG
ncbi:unnamed protein product, partial [Choristocarpus tenellus]